MTNTRITDPEVLERCYPVRLREFCIRRGSGGKGRHRGGAGVRRSLEFLRPLLVSIVSQRRGPYRPYGLAGGEPGSAGRNRLERPGAPVRELPGNVQLAVAPGDVLVIETPGGGGYGKDPGETFHFAGRRGLGIIPVLVYSRPGARNARR